MRSEEIRRKNLFESFTSLSLLGLKDEFPRSLSGGELKRVLLARALMNEPELIIADELTSDLDNATTKDIIYDQRPLARESTQAIGPLRTGDRRRPLHSVSSSQPRRTRTRQTNP